MRSPKGIATCVRKPNGEIATITSESKPLTARLHMSQVPIIRGVLAFVDSIITGTSTLMQSAEIALEDEEPQDKPKSKTTDTIITYASVFFALIIGIGLFFLLPNYLVSIFKSLTEYALVRTIMEGAVRLLIFFVYILLISRMKDIQRVFQYHGAEHKTIFCYESDLPLTVENARAQSRLHPRCGTSFLLMVMVVSIIVFFFIPSTDVITRTVYRLALLPVVAGISYELIRFSGKYENALTRIMRAPGVGLQYFTTREPDDSQLEVAIAALNASLKEGESA